MTSNKWFHGNNPPEEGWYCVLYAWDEYPEISSITAYYYKNEWSHCLPVIAWLGPFNYEELPKSVSFRFE